MQKGICPRCGNKTVNGMCIDCGITGVDEGFTLSDLKNTPPPQKFSKDAAPLTEVAPPPVHTLTGEDAENEKKTVLPKFVNPYIGVIPFEAPDFGDAYSVAGAVIKERGAPTALPYKQDPGGLISRHVKLRSGRKLREFWWIILISMLLPWEASWIAAPAMLKFDEKGARQAGWLIIAGTAVKFMAEMILSISG